MSRQLVLDLPLRTALGRDDFLVTPSNAAAVAMIDRYPDWLLHLSGTETGTSELQQELRRLTRRG